MSSANATLYYTAIDDMFKELLLDTNEEEQVPAVEIVEPLIVTPKRIVRIRKLNLLAKAADTEEFVICRRMPMPETQLQLSPRSRELRRERQANDLLQLRRQRCEAEQRRPMRRLTMRI